MVCVIIYHSCLFWSGNWFTVQPVQLQARLLGLIAGWLNSFHIYGFTFVSGYIFQYLKHEKGKYSVFHDLLQNKIKRLIVPYFFAMAIWVAPISIIIFSYSIREIIINYLLCANPSQLWFLWMLFGVFLLVYPLSNYLNNDTIAILISLVAWLISYYGGNAFPNIFCIWTAFDYLPYFILGMKIREKQYDVSNGIFAWFMIVLQTSVYVMFVVLSNIVSGFSLSCIDHLVHVLGALTSFFFLQWLSSKINWKKYKLFNYFSKRSMPIYLFHQQVIYLTIILLNGKVNPYINATLNFVVATVVSAMISSYLLKYKWTSILIGERRK